MNQQWQTQLQIDTEQSLKNSAEPPRDADGLTSSDQHHSSFKAPLPFAIPLQDSPKKFDGKFVKQRQIVLPRLQLEKIKERNESINNLLSRNLSANH